MGSFFRTTCSAPILTQSLSLRKLGIPFQQFFETSMFVFPVKKTNRSGSTDLISNSFSRTGVYKTSPTGTSFKILSNSVNIYPKTMYDRLFEIFYYEETESMGDLEKEKFLFLLAFCIRVFHLFCPSMVIPQASEGAFPCTAESLTLGIYVKFRLLLRIKPMLECTLFY